MARFARPVDISCLATVPTFADTGATSLMAGDVAPFLAGQTEVTLLVTPLLAISYDELGPIQVASLEFLDLRLDRTSCLVRRFEVTFILNNKL